MSPGARETLNHSLTFFHQLRAALQGRKAAVDWIKNQSIGDISAMEIKLRQALAEAGDV